MHVQVREAACCKEYARLFRLYADAPNMGRALMDIFMDRMRHAALVMVVRAYKTNPPLPFLARLLGFLAAGTAHGTAPIAKAAGVAANVALPGARQPGFPGKHAPQASSIPRPLAALGRPPCSPSMSS